MNESSNNVAREKTFTWMDRLARLFPHNHCCSTDAPGKWKDCLFLCVTVELSWLDRLRVFFTGRLEVRSRTLVEHEAGDILRGSITASEINVLPWKFMERKD